MAASRNPLIDNESSCRSSSKPRKRATPKRNKIAEPKPAKVQPTAQRKALNKIVNDVKERRNSRKMAFHELDGSRRLNKIAAGASAKGEMSQFEIEEERKKQARERYTNQAFSQMSAIAGLRDYAVVEAERDQLEIKVPPADEEDLVKHHNRLWNLRNELLDISMLQKEAKRSADEQFKAAEYMRCQINNTQYAIGESKAYGRGPDARNYYGPLNGLA